MLRADNAGPMTLDGTRSYVLRAPGATGCVVVDPGPDLDDHLDALAAAGPVELVLITHRHPDHTAGSAGLRERTGAPVRARDPEFCLGGEPLHRGDVLDVAGLRIEVLATPGHTRDSVAFVVSGPSGGASGDQVPRAGSTAGGTAARHAETVVLTGDTVLGQGTTVIAEPDGSLRDYFESLDLLEAVGAGVLGLPAHGDPIGDLAAAVRMYRAHRIERLEQVRHALERLGVPDDGRGAQVSELADAVVEAVYADVDPGVRGAARQSVTAQLDYLLGE
ncbi:MBL fold metallo-hydrolase [Myceligenerans xiligouense]|uniref:Glyoxylase-like metal-dependent hydrolase (Beta-lactamase superfamily II) n=1 Tax=Myceligenerans xiligouense TaxID=253184 RepID=A0A3N4ZTY2_9MICO|nr:MBL fold metallo-hydrolase [Myceligenerans xiligouense]RPF23221.1 glyoxylase-like metal-dependent hydrolase (beta-lactamase superfamily II) [Myceligenerans xiligouense]